MVGICGIDQWARQQKLNAPARLAPDAPKQQILLFVQVNPKKHI